MAVNVVMTAAVGAAVSVPAVLPAMMVNAPIFGVETMKIVLPAWVVWEASALKVMVAQVIRALIVAPL